MTGKQHVSLRVSLQLLLLLAFACQGLCQLVQSEGKAHDVTSVLAMHRMASMGQTISVHPGDSTLAGRELSGTVYIHSSCHDPAACPVAIDGTLGLKDGSFFIENIAFNGAINQNGNAPIQVYGVSQVFLVNCSFSNILGTGVVQGDGVNVNITIVDSTFLSNTCDSKGCGGAVTVTSGARLITLGAQFLNNSAVYGGGAILIGKGGISVLARSQFIGNEVTGVSSGSSHNAGEADYIGGAVVMEGGGSHGVIRNCMFIDNSAEQKGGAIAVWDYAELCILESRFEGNYAQSGGAIFVGTASKDEIFVRTQMWVYSSGFDGNGLTSSIAEGDGSAIEAVSSMLYMVNTTFTNHHSLGLGTVALRSTKGYNDALLNLFNVTFRNNSAKAGGAVYASSRAIISAVLVVFDRCTAMMSGGAMSIAQSQMNAAAITCRDCRAGLIIDPAATGDGGCWSITDSRVVLAPVEQQEARPVEIDMIPHITPSWIADQVAVFVSIEDTYTYFSFLFDATLSARSVLDSCVAVDGSAFKGHNSNITIAGVDFGDSDPLTTGVAPIIVLMFENSQVFITDSFIVEPSCWDLKTVYIESGNTLIADTRFECDKNAEMRTQVPAARGSIVLDQPNSAVFQNVTFDYTNAPLTHYSIGCNAASTSAVYANFAEVPLRSPPVASGSGWAECWTLQVVDLVEGGNTSCGYKLSSMSTIPSATTTMFMHVPLLATLADPGSTGSCTVNNTLITKWMDAAQPFLVQTRCHADTVPLEQPGALPLGLVLGLSFGVFTATYVIVFSVFACTGPSIILDKTNYKNNIPLLKDKPSKKRLAMIEDGTGWQQLHGQMVRLVQKAYRCWCKGVETFAMCLMCQWGKAFPSGREVR